MKLPRASGILLHPTSLPSPFGIGDLGPSAEAFLDQLVIGGQRFWQILPLGPTGYGHSPYACYSAFAGNPWLISPERLVADRFLEPSEIEAFPPPDPSRGSDGAGEKGAGGIDFDAVRACKVPLFERAFERFRAGLLPAETEAFESFRRDPLIRPWLEDYALFMALKETHEDAVWTAWDPPLALRAPVALAHYAEAERERILFHEFLQYLFFKQWRRLKGEAQKRKIEIIGDIPIFVAHDSADVWCHPELFELDEMGSPTVVSGVPPDYFSKTGQRWGNPLYRWEAMAATGYAWWTLRFRLLLELVDVVRLDHFRGFEAYWEIPA
ncbi:MAG: 4-alpha-glucanotransferase, partial [Deltaproteobacteria bacterium]